MTPCRIPSDIAGLTGEDALTALTEWGSALRECSDRHDALIRASGIEQK